MDAYDKKTASIDFGTPQCPATFRIPHLWINTKSTSSK